MEQEIWKPIPGYEGLYEASNLGRVKSLYSNKILIPYLEKSGYYRVSLSLNKKIIKFLIHVLVAKSFLRFNSNYQVNHKDLNKLNNHLDNLEIVNQHENQSHRYKNKKFKGVCKITWNDGVVRYRAKTMINNKHIHIGCFSTEEEAHEAYICFLKNNGIENKYATKS